MRKTVDYLIGQPFRFATIYASVAGLWILFSDRVLLWLITDSRVLNRLQTIRLWLLILASSAIVYWLLRRNHSLLAREERTEERITEISEQLRLITDSIPAHIAYIDRDLRYRFVNKSYRETLGITAEEIIGKTVRETLSDKVFLKIKQYVDEVLAGKKVNYVFDTTDATGGNSYLQISYLPHFDENGNVIGFFGQMYDITPHMMAEEALQAQLNFLQVLIDTIPNPIFYKNTEGIYLGCNEAFQKFLGKSMEEIVGKTVYDLAPTELAQKYFEMDSALLNHPGIQIYEASVLYADGTRHEVVFNKATFNNQNGTLGGLVGVILDVTERKRIEESLKDIQLHQKAILDNIPDLVWLKDNESRFVTVNEAFAKACGLMPQDLQGKTDYEVWPRDLATKYCEDDATVMRSGEQSCVEELLGHYDGNRKWFETIKMPIHNEKGEVVGTTGIARNIHTRKLAEEALRESEERFYQIFAQNEDAIILFRLDDFAIIDANSTAFTLYGMSRTEMIGLHPSSLFGPGDFKKFIDIIPKSDNHFRSFQLDRAYITTRAGRKIIASVRGKIIRLQNEYAVYCSIRDMTEKVHLEQEIKTTQAKLIHANKMTSLGMLASSIAHEINNPNNYISVNASVLAEAWEDATAILTRYHMENGEFLLGGLPFSEIVELAPRLFKGIVEGSGRINAIITNMREYVRPHERVSHTRIDINKIVQDATTILWHHIHKNTDKFKMTLADDLSFAIGNNLQIEQVMINLIMNSLQSLTSRESEVSVATFFDRESSSIVITVSDQGKGMSKKVLERITEPFFSTRMDEGGTGLGLYISSTIISEHNGSLEFDSAPGKGTSVTVRLPSAD